MYCPKCAAQNLDNAKFCRSCGTNLSLVPQALTGQLPTAPETTDNRRRKHSTPSIERAFKNIFIGVAFLLISLILSLRGGAAWWFWLLIPAFALMGGGLAEFMRAKGRERGLPFGEPERMVTGHSQASMAEAEQAAKLPSRNTSELAPQPPSVTEGTTRHLGAEAPTRHFEAGGGDDSK